MFSVKVAVTVLVLRPLATSVCPFFGFGCGAPVRSLQGVNDNRGSSIMEGLCLDVRCVITFVLVIISVFFTGRLCRVARVSLNCSASSVIGIRFRHCRHGRPAARTRCLGRASLHGTSGRGVSATVGTSPLFAT